MNENVNTNSKPWVSFCMSTYKRPAFLEKQIQRLLQQTFSSFEIVISDNDPEGSAQEVIRKFNDPRIRYYINSQNLGMVKSFNNSLALSEGAYIVMITDDDPVYRDMLQTLYNLSIKYPGYGVYHGGCEILCHTAFGAKVMRSKVGVNSCLSPEMDYNAEKVYTASEFPYLFLQGKLGSLLLWSTGIVRRDIILQNGGMPDYGTEYFTDHAFTLVNCSHSGMVYLNRSLGYQDIHGENFGFNNLKNLEKYEKIPDSFTQWVSGKLNYRSDWQALQKHLYIFTGRSLVEFSLFIKKSLEEKRLPLADFRKKLNKVFDRPYLKKWKVKYFILSNYPTTFEILLKLKNTITG